MPNIAGSFNRGQRLGSGSGGGQALLSVISLIMQQQLQRERFAETQKQNEFYRNLHGRQEERLSGLFPAGVDPRFRTPLQQRASEFSREIGPDFQRAQEQQVLEAEQTEAREARAKAAKPPARDISTARKDRDRRIKKINALETSLVGLREKHDLGPGETPQPKIGRFSGAVKNQDIIDNFDKLQQDIANERTSLDSLFKDAEAKGIDLKFAAPSIISPQTDERGLNIGQIYEGKDGKREYLGNGIFGPLQ